jgi:hypothetical protein
MIDLGKDFIRLHAWSRGSTYYYNDGNLQRTKGGETLTPVFYISGSKTPRLVLSFDKGKTP